QHPTGGTHVTTRCAPALASRALPDRARAAARRARPVGGLLERQQGRARQRGGEGGAQRGARYRDHHRSRRDAAEGRRGDSGARQRGGPPMSVAVTPDQGLALVTSSTKKDPADATKTVPDNRLSVV